jgi:hypothetical protein
MAGSFDSNGFQIPRTHLILLGFKYPELAVLLSPMFFKYPELMVLLSPMFFKDPELVVIKNCPHTVSNLRTSWELREEAEASINPTQTNQEWWEIQGPV